MIRPPIPLRIPTIALPLVAVASAGLALAIGAGVCALYIGATLAEITVAARRARHRLTLNREPAWVPERQSTLFALEANQ